MQNRREFLVSAAGTATLTVSGCSTGSDDGGDEDPGPEVSTPEATVAETLSPSPKPTETESPTDTPTETETPTEVLESENQLEVTDDYWSEATHITAYSAGTVEATIRDDLSIDFESYRAVAAVYTFPRDEGLAVNQSDSFTSSDIPLDVSISIDASSIPVGERVHYMLLVGRDVPLEQIEASDLEHMMDSDPFARSGGRIERNPHPEEVGSESTEQYERRDVEGAYPVFISGRTAGSEWQAGIQVFKAAFIDRATAARGRARPEYVNYEMSEGNGGEVAQVLWDEAEELGFETKRERTEFAIDFVQALPYVPDDVSTDFDDYTKFILETLVDGGGDCEDSAILLGSTLQSEPFGYDVVLLQPPGHMAVGIAGEDLPGGHVTYRGTDYYYIEPTGQGWGVGDVPEPYQGVEIRVHEV